MVVTSIDVEWNGISPNLKGEIVKDAGVYVADPYLVLRAGIFANTSEPFNLFSPAVTGRLERVVFIPDHKAATQPGVGGTIDIEVFQHYPSDAPTITTAIAPFPFADTLDLLNGQGLAIPNGVITHLSAWGSPPYPGTVLTPILPQILIQDKLRIFIDDWADPAGEKIMFMYLYFTTGSPFPLSQPINVVI